jgi:chromosome segregation ATPase
MQQDLEDEKYEATIKDLENKVKDHEAALEKKDFVIHSMEGSLAEAQAEIDRLNRELLIKSEKSEQEKKNLETSLKTEIEKSSNLQKSFVGTMLRHRRSCRKKQLRLKLSACDDRRFLFMKLRNYKPT